MKKPLPSIDELHRLFECREDGVLIRKVTVRGKGSVAGSVAGNLAGTGYLQVNACCVQLLVHRVVWAMTNGSWPEHLVDHVNGVRTDNRPCNLRAATQSQNLMNRGPSRNNTTGAKGVVKARNGRFYARIRVAGKQINLGHYDTVAQAAEAYRTAAELNHGEFARCA